LRRGIIGITLYRQPEYINGHLVLGLRHPPEVCHGSHHQIPCIEVLGRAV
jgi:hypothetical protein